MVPVIGGEILEFLHRAWASSEGVAVSTPFSSTQPVVWRTGRVWAVSRWPACRQSLPADERKDFIHQEAGGQVRPLALEVLPQQVLGGLVAPDEVPGGVVVAEPLLGGGVQVDAQLGIHGPLLPIQGLWSP